MIRSTRRIVGIFALCAVILIATFALSACGGSAEAGSPSKAKETPVSLNGTWKAEGFEAVITDNNIEIQIVSPDMKSLYWKGTFPAPAGDTVTSVADTEALSMSMLGSQDPDKQFTVSDDQIDFEMSMMGTTRVVHLKR